LERVAGFQSLNFLFSNCYSLGNDSIIDSVMSHFFQKIDFLGPVYTWRLLTGVKFNNNWTQYYSPEIFWQCNQNTEPELLSVKFSDYVYFMKYYDFFSILRSYAELND